MGIKRTPTGRIYYDSGDARQSQMVSLLGQLGERLKRSEAEREEIWKELQEYRKLIADIEDKSAVSEKVYLNVQNKLAQAERTEAELRARQDQLEKSQKEQVRKGSESGKGGADLVKRLNENDTLIAHLVEKLEASDAQQKRLDRRLEKMTQERVRLLRKLERLEETLIETQDVLRARALVLLTDRSLAAQSGLPQLSALSGLDDDIKLADQGDRTASGEAVTGDAPAASAGLPLWQRALRPRTATAAALTVFALLCGWTVSEMMRGETTVAPGTVAESGIGSAGIEPAAGAASGAQQASEGTEDTASQGSKKTSAGATADESNASVWTKLESELSDSEAGAEEGGRADVEAAEAGASPDTGEAPGAVEKAPQAASDKVSVEALQSGDYDEAVLAREMQADPDAVAAKLNQIEPGVGPASSSEVARGAQAGSGDKAAEEAAYTQGAKAGPSESQLKAMMPPDAALPESARRVEKQAYAGNANAQHDLAAVYTAGQGGIKQDYARAAFWFRQAADRGVANARYNLGVLYHQGLGVKQDVNEAIRMYQQAAVMGHPEAEYNLGIAYIEGIGVPYDPRKAADFFEKAANQHIVEAAYNLGLIYENGLLGDPNPEEALLWFKMASDGGSPEARRAMEQLAKTLKIEPSQVDDLVEKARALKGAAAEAPGAQRTNVATTSETAAAAGANPLDIAPGAIAVPPAAGNEVTRQIQIQLIGAGLLPGPADGIFGQQTADAIRSYQKRENLPVDGKASQDLLVHMLAAEMEGAGETSSRAE